MKKTDLGKAIKLLFNVEAPGFVGFELNLKLDEHFVSCHVLTHSSKEVTSHLSQDWSFLTSFRHCTNYIMDYT